MLRSILAFVAVLAVLPLAPLRAADPPNDGPRILVAQAIALPAGSTTKVTLRGMKLTEIKEAKCDVPAVAIKIAGKGGTSVPQKFEAKRTGDTQIELELQLPAQGVPAKLPITLVPEKGANLTWEFLVGGELPLVAEKEGNDGFAQAQVVAIPQIVDGAIQSGQDVDVFAIEVTEPTKLRAAVLAARHGSLLDATLTVYTARGEILASADDGAESADPEIEVSLPSAGKYFVAVADALDHGGPTHPYRLMLRRP